MRSRFWGNATGVRGRGVGFRPTVEAKNTITTTDCDTFEGANSTVVTDVTAHDGCRSEFAGGFLVGSDYCYYTEGAVRAIRGT